MTWIRATLIRAVRTAAQTALSLIPTTALLIEGVNWAVVGSGSALAFVLSVLTAIAFPPPEAA